VTPQATDPLGQGLWQGAKTALEGAPGGEALVLAKQFAQEERISGVRSSSTASNSPTLCKRLTIMMVSALRKRVSG
jgi:hypothetical protein